MQQLVLIFPSLALTAHLMPPRPLAEFLEREVFSKIELAIERENATGTPVTDQIRVRLYVSETWPPYEDSDPRPLGIGQYDVHAHQLHMLSDDARSTVSA